MTIDTWLMIAMNISTLIAPSLANLIQSRTNKPNSPWCKSGFASKNF